MRLFQTTPTTLLTLCASCAFLFALSAQGASFDCGKAKSKVEHIICDDAEISKLDDELNETYKAEMKDKSRAASIKKAQKLWMKERNGCKYADCVKASYEKQMQHFRDIEKDANGLVVGRKSWKKLSEHYVLRFSEDDSVCKPILAEYNRNIQLDFYEPRPLYYYPWPAPPKLAVEWKVKPWSKSIPERDRVSLEYRYSVIEADVGGDGETETIVRWADWLRKDERFSDLDIFLHGTAVLGSSRDEYQTQAMQQATKVMGGPAGGYNFPKLKGQTSPRTLNDFDVIQLNGKYYVTGKTVDMDGITEMRDSPRWRVISRVRFGEPETPPEDELDWILDSVCYFEMNQTK